MGLQATSDCVSTDAKKRKKKLTQDERGTLADKLIGMGDRGGGRTWMDRLEDKIDSYSVQRPEAEVVYRNLSVTTDALVGASAIPNVASPAINLLKRLMFMRVGSEHKDLKLVDDVSGVLKPGRLTLLLGPPSSGKSTFMKALAGRLHEAQHMQMSGDVWFNGQAPSQFNQARSVAYVAQLDNHEANLTVQETLDFAYLCLAGTHGPRFDLPHDICEKKLQALEALRAGDVEAGHAGTQDDVTGAANNGLIGIGHGNGHIHPMENGDSKPSSPRRLLSKKASSKRDAAAAVLMDDFEETLKQVWGTNVKVDVVMKLLGVFHCRNTMVGNEIFRGISGGEKKRLTTAEQVLSQRSVVLLDEISTGLDSATLFTVIRWFSKWCHAMHSTMMISLLQPPPEVFQLFDDILIFSGGQELYHGPMEGAVPFFASLGFECPVRKDVPSFLLEVTTAKGQHQYANAALRAAHNLPLNGDFSKMSRSLNKHQLLVPVAEMRRAFWDQNEHGKAMAKELLAAPVTRPSHPGALATTSAYPLRPHEAIMVATRRQVTLVLRDKVLLKGRLMQVTVISLITGSLFYMLPVTLTGARSFFGLYFLNVLFINFGGFPQLPLTVESKKVWFKHRSNGFLPAYAQGLAMSFAQIPLSVIEACVFSLIMYFMVGMYVNAAHFFTFWLISFTVSLTSSALFRFLGCVSPNMVIANAAGGLMLLILIVSSGFAILRQDIPNWMIWAYWLSPFSWALRALAINEMMTPKWNDQPYPDDPTLPLGEGALLSFGFYTERYWVWADIGYQFAIFAALTIGAILSLWLQKAEQPRASLPDEEAVTAARAQAEEHRQELAAMREAAANGAANGEYQKQLSHKDSRGAQTMIEGATSGSKGQTNGEVVSAGSKRYGEGPATGSKRHTVEVDIDIASSLEFQPITLVFKDISYTVPNPQYNRGAAKAAAKAAAKTTSAPGPGSVSVAMDRAASAGPSAIKLQPNAAYKEGKGTPESSSGNTPIVAMQPMHAAAGGRTSTSLQQGSVPPVSVTADRTASAQITAERTSSIQINAGERTSSIQSNGERPSSVLRLQPASSLQAAASGSLPAALTPQNMATKEKLQLLSDITGFVEPGVLMALMGGSGAGKTTLMDCLAGRKTVGEISGDILVNGHPKEQRTWARVVGYCEQNDIHTPLQTVKDALLFSARLRLPTSIPDSKVHAYVDEVMDIVDLMDIMYNLVGSPGMSGLSVEQRKRLTIAVELVANPSVVFMDEPTSGLDARAAAIVMQAVRNVARNGRTVMVTIHQPSIEIFEAFDKLLLIQRGGRTTYFGPLGEHSSALIAYLTSVPGTPDLLPGYNPATWMLEVTGGSMATMVEAVDVDWPSVYAGSALASEAKEYANWLVAEAQAAGEPALAITSDYAQPFQVQLLWLLKKFQWAFWHNPSHNFIRFMTTFITAFIYAAMYWKQGKLPSPASIANVQAIMGIMYSSTNFLGMINLMSGMPIVGYERVVFYRERSASMYNPFAYGIAMSLVELPYLFGQALIFVPVIYWMVGFKAQADLFFYYFIMFLETIAFYSIFGQFLIYVTPSQGIGQVLGGSLNFIFNIFNGFVITYTHMPKGWRWLNRIVPSTWIIYGLAISQLDDEDIPMTYNGQETNVQQFMEAEFGYFPYMQWWCLLIVFAYIIFMRVTSILALRYWNFLRR